MSSADGAKAKYRKTSNFLVLNDGVYTYKEGVAAAGIASGFTTLRGVISSTKREHGFFVSDIDLGVPFHQGDRFTNTFSAELYDCFSGRYEHWTQEVALPTKHLIIQVHFPIGRAPLLVTCKRVDGMVERRIQSRADIVEVGGRKSIIWEIKKPKLRDIYKLEWVW